MFKWMVGYIVDTLLVFLIATLLLWYGAAHFPDFFPSKFFQYWGG